MKRDQVRKNGEEQIIPITTRTFKQFLKCNITQIIKYTFIWGIINKQSVPNMGVGKFRKENNKVLVENQLLRMTSEKMIIFLAKNS
jgi:hypothetical protein